MNETTKKGLARIAKDFTEIANGKTWRVTGRAFTSNGKSYSVGDEAPKTNAKVFGWTMNSALFTLDNAKAFAQIVTDEIANALIESAPMVAKYNHADRVNAFHAVVEYASTAKVIKAEKVADLIANAKTAKVATAKTEKVADLSILGL